MNRKYIHVIGDSHSIYSFSRINEVKVHWLGPVTMHRIGRDGCDALTEKIEINPGDTCVFVSGEIDIRCHVERIAQADKVRSLSVIAKLATDYVREVSEFSERRELKNGAIFGCPAPTHHKENPDFPVYGSMTQRVENTILMNEMLKAECAKTGVLFVEFPKIYVSRRGELRKHLTDGIVHVAPSCSLPVCKYLGRAIGEALTFRRDPIVRRISDSLIRRLPGPRRNDRLMKMSPNPILELQIHKDP